jgi:hypothetical protein
MTIMAKMVSGNLAKVAKDTETAKWPAHLERAWSLAHVLVNQGPMKQRQAGP